MFNGVAIEYDDSVISSNGFWGDIEVSEFQKQRAIPVQVPIEMIKASLIQAMQEVELELEEVADRYQAKGILHVREITAVQIGGENFAQTQYKKAVFARAKADLLPEFLTLSAREIHEGRELVQAQKSLLAESSFAIRRLKGKKRGKVWLL
ncbi:head completion/stabilization protein [Avibacterium paragallinarum]|uniref:Head stabilization protein n=3 Tax=Avibacterium paragallinarum TaxID=728 RepID=A0AAE5TKT6_AVIPA|nr:head completion/stabilization protein [Avibacterium paragallinarum]MEE3608251.1 head completion/stabilization protein [Avibacterium paragallinarum]MEE3621625.1 head completion/stabilization protein [Avibacterium paragallinarum]MEE3669446.1 head completion/stabilization protein [Avibacterium paragallinarum]MEE3680410.1 head completion/stabilization protein [Avibacterium paragallinarum]MEE4385931.1 head completion/stabilization protein [Avibacterium paragallinarum]